MNIAASMWADTFMKVLLNAFIMKIIFKSIKVVAR